MPTAGYTSTEFSRQDNTFSEVIIDRGRAPKVRGLFGSTALRPLDMSTTLRPLDMSATLRSLDMSTTLRLLDIDFADRPAYTETATVE